MGELLGSNKFSNSFKNLRKDIAVIIHTAFFLVLVIIFLIGTLVAL